MTQLTLYTGATANDGTGDTLLVAGAKINSNFTELYTRVDALVTYSLPTASASVLGGVRVDGTSVVINNGVISSINAGTGNVIGPATATDNAITRFDATTGKLLQNSLVTITDLGAIVAPIASSVIPFHYDNQASFPSATTYHGAIAHSHADGKMYFAHSGAWLAMANASDVPAAQVQTDWNAVSGLGVVLNKPTLFSGSYADLTNKPTIPAAQVQTDWNAVSGLGVVLNKPTLFSGSYADLTNKPTIPSSLSTLSGVTITTPIAGQVLKYNGSVWINDVDATSGGAGVGTVTNVSVTSANGFTGSVATASSTPAITITTSITGLLKGNGTAVSAAVAGTDYLTSITSSNVTTALGFTPYNATNPSGYITTNGIPSQTGNSGRVLSTDGTTLSWTVAATGSVASVSVVSANGFTGTVSTSTTTPAITITTSITGVLKGNGTAVSAAVAGTDYQAPLPTQTGQTGKYLTTDGTTLSWGTVSAGVGTVTTVSVASANGFTGTVATSTTTPAITITTSITGLLKGNATAISAATAGTDYQAPISATGILKSSGVSGNVSAAVAGTDYQAPIGTISGLVKGNGANALAAATAGTDYQAPIGTISGIVKGNGANALAAATAGTDYQAPITLTTTGSSGEATFSGNTLNIPQYASSGISWTISASGASDYVFSGPGIVAGNTNDPVLYLYRGFTYTFVNTTTTSHPFAIRVSNGGSAYTSGLTGTQTGTQTFTVPMNAPSTLYYQCTIHSGMGNVINIV
jgi:hypothetical protein